MITLILSVCFTLSATDVSAQQCEYKLESGGEINTRFIYIDGELFFYAPEEIGVKILKDKNELETLKQKQGLLKQKLELKQEIIDAKDLQLAAARDSYEMMKFLADQAQEQRPDRWYESRSVTMAATFLFTAMAFGYWSFTVKNLTGGSS